MASDSNQPLTLMNIPLEVRHQIFEYVAVRDVKPAKLLRYWFEKKEVKEKTAELVAKDPSAGRPRIVYEGDRFEAEEQEEDDSEQGEDGEQDSDQDSDEEEDSDEDRDEDAEEEDDDEEGEAEEQDTEMADDNGTAVPAAAASTVPANAQGSTATDTTSPQATTRVQQDPAAADQPTESTVADQLSTDFVQDLSAAMAAANDRATAEAQGSTVAATKPSSTVAPTQSQDDAEAEDADADMAEDGEEDGDAEDGAAEAEDAQMDGGEEDENEDEDDNGDADGDSDEEMADEDDDGDAAAGSAQPPPAPVITAHRKWRHIPQFMRITHCPPTVELFLTSKQLNAEAKNWFYDVAVLHIEATGSFAHTSFFEEAFSQITEAAFSPMEDIRKAEVTFVWDTTWLRSDRADCAAAIFPALLRQRAIFVTGILAQAPNLSEVTIHWHDSAEDEEAVDLMNDVLVGFLGLDATVKVEPHYIAADAKPYRKSMAGKQRVEFQRIVNNGLDRLF